MRLVAGRGQNRRPLGRLGGRQVPARQVDHDDRAAVELVGAGRDRDRADAAIGEDGRRLECSGSIVGGHEQFHTRILAETPPGASMGLKLDTVLAMARTSPARTGTARNGDCSLYFETFGDSADATLLLVNGLGSQCINYDEAWCAMFVDEGLHVVRFDNRDVGLSSHFPDAPIATDGSAYSLLDMAADAVAVLDAVGVERAHVMGLSMGGMIVQQLAIHHRDRLRSMISVMSRTGERDSGHSTAEAYAHLTGASATDRESAITNHLAGQRIWGSPDHFDEQRLTTAAARAFDRAFDPGGVQRQFAAVGAAGSWADQLPGVTTPTLVIHGTADTLIDISGGRRTAELIPGATLVEIDGMGHDYPPVFQRRMVDEVAAFIRAIEAS